MPKPPKPKAKKSETKSQREVLYPKVEAKLCVGEQAITRKIAQSLLGWQEQPKEATDYDFIDETGCKIKCHNNCTNRPIYQSVLATLRQEHLRKRWLMNGEPIIIGETGLILNGQHSLISFIFAVQTWAQDKEKWEEWEEEPVMEKLVVFGINESDTVVNTMDTCKPRTFADAIYRSGFFPASMGKNEIRRISRTLDYAVKMLWHRTGADENPFAPRRTHSEGLAFIAKHPKIVECVKHIHEEDGDNKQIGRYISTGYAAGMLYLMACCRSENVEEYKRNPSEEVLDFSAYDMACDFWVKLAGKDPAFKALQAEFQRMIEDTGGTRPERTALISKAWLRYQADEPITAKAIALEYSTDDDGFRTLAENPIIGGIDAIDLSEHGIVDPTPEELEERAEAIRKEKADKKSNGKGKKKPKPAAIEPGTQVWVLDEGGYSTGKVTECYDAGNGLVCKVKFRNGKTFEEPVENCLTEQPADL